MEQYPSESLRFAVRENNTLCLNIQDIIHMKAQPHVFILLRNWILVPEIIVLGGHAPLRG